MKTLADVKRRMTVGTVVDAVNHKYPHLSGQRTVVKAQTNSFAMTIPGHNDDKPSWLDWPPKAGIRIDDDNTVTFLIGDCPRATGYLSPSEHAKWKRSNTTFTEPLLTITFIDAAAR